LKPGDPSDPNQDKYDEHRDRSSRKTCQKARLVLVSPLTKVHLSELREELEGQLARLMRSIEASKAALEPVELDQSRVGRLSRMDELQNQSLTRNLHEREEIRLTLVRNALSRMDEGTYGMCAACESDIPYERLLIFPEAVECGGCA